MDSYQLFRPLCEIAFPSEEGPGHTVTTELDSSVVDSKLRFA
jgi:hypothetical protein